MTGMLISMFFSFTTKSTHLLHLGGSSYLMQTLTFSLVHEWDTNRKHPQQVFTRHANVNERNTMHAFGAVFKMSEKSRLTCLRFRLYFQCSLVLPFAVCVARKSNGQICHGYQEKFKGISFSRENWTHSPWTSCSACIESFSFRKQETNCSQSYFSITAFYLLSKKSVINSTGKR